MQATRSGLGARRARGHGKPRAQESRTLSAALHYCTGTSHSHLHHGCRGWRAGTCHWLAEGKCKHAHVWAGLTACGGQREADCRTATTLRRNGERAAKQEPPTARAPGGVVRQSLHAKRAVARGKNTRGPVGSRDCPGCISGAWRGKWIGGLGARTSKDKARGGHMRVSTKAGRSLPYVLTVTREHLPQNWHQVTRAV